MAAWQPPVVSVGHKLQLSAVQEEDPPDRVLRGQQDPDQDERSEGTHHVDPPQELNEDCGDRMSPNKEDNEDETRCYSDPPQEQQLVPVPDPHPTHDDKGGVDWQDQNMAHSVSLDGAAANQGESGESGGSVPALVITQAEESRPVAVSPPETSAELTIPLPVPVDTSRSSSGNGGDMVCADLMSLRSDSPNISQRSEEDDTRSVAASSVMSLFHRVPLDPLEKDWWRSSALGNMAALRHLLAQEPGLVLKKTALHWAAKHGHQEVVDMMLHFGADVNVRSGYTALHLAAIHSHKHVVQALINTYHAKTNVRDYHGKMAEHYWGGCADIFSNSSSQSGGRSSRGRATQRYAFPALLLSRSRSQGQLQPEVRMLPPSRSNEMLDIRI